MGERGGDLATYLGYSSLRMKPIWKMHFKDSLMAWHIEAKILPYFDDLNLLNHPFCLY
jgi:hypothetical protein